MATGHFRKTDDYPTRTPAGESRQERKDPVVWGTWSPDAPLSRDQTSSFAENGFIVLKNLFSPAEVRALQRESDDLRANGSNLIEGSVITEPGSEDVRTVFQLERQSGLFDRLARDRRLAGIIGFLLDDDIYVSQSRLNYKPGFAGKEFYWHSDFETWHAEDGMPRMRCISASVLLTENDALNGPLMLIPGSQKKFIACRGETPEDNHKTSLKKQEIGVPSHAALAGLARENGIEYGAGPAGTVILFDCNTIHGSNGNITPFPRSNAFFVFNAWSNRLKPPFAAPKPRPDFLAVREPGAPLTIESGSFA